MPEPNRSGLNPFLLHEWLWWLIVIFGYGFFALMFVCGMIGWDPKPIADEYLSKGGLQIAFGLGTLFSGLGLYQFRCRHLQWYAKLEVGIGIALATYVANLTLNMVSVNANAWFTALGALYIIVRGMDNWYRSLDPGTRNTREWNRVFFGKDTGAKL